MSKLSKSEMTDAENMQYTETILKYTHDDEKDPFEQWNEKAKGLQKLHPDLTIEQAKDKIAESNDWIRERIDQ